MDLLSTLLVCNLYGTDPTLVRAITANSHANPHFVLDASADVDIDAVPAEPKTTAEALARVQEITAHGGKPLLGLLQIPPAWLALYGRELPDAFDPCVNVAIGSAMLSTFDYECAHDKKRPHPGPSPADHPRPTLHVISARRLCVIRRYGEAIGEADFEELTTLELNSPSPTRGLLPDPTDAPIFPSQPPRTWGPDCLLVPFLVTPPTPQTAIQSSDAPTLPTTPTP
jgi:hypothetical protein